MLEMKMNVGINLQQPNSVVYVVYSDFHRLIVDVIDCYLDVYWNFYHENVFSSRSRRKIVVSYVGLTIR